MRTDTDTSGNCAGERFRAGEPSHDYAAVRISMKPGTLICLQSYEEDERRMDATNVEPHCDLQIDLRYPVSQHLGTRAISMK